MADAPALVDGLDDIRVSQMLSKVPFPYRAADAEGFIALAKEENAAGAHLHLVIAHEGEVVGGIGAYGLPDVDDFGYWLRRSAWGKGFATEAAAGLLSHLFGRLGADRVPSGVFVDNPASLRVQEKLGFERIGTSQRISLARGHAVAHIDTLLTRARFEELHR